MANLSLFVGLLSQSERWTKQDRDGQSRTRPDDDDNYDDDVDDGDDDVGTCEGMWT